MDTDTERPHLENNGGFSKVPDIVVSNPFRILGVYSDARQSTLVRQYSMIKAFLTVGRKVDIICDRIHFLPPLDRSLGSLEQAKNRLVGEKDKLKYALFWFIEDEELGSEFNELFSLLELDDVEKIESILSQNESYASLANRAVLFLCQGDYRNAIMNYSALLHNDKFRHQFLSRICGNTSSYSDDYIFKVLIDELYDYAAPDYFSNDRDRQYYLETITSVLTERINNAIGVSRNICQTDPKSAYIAGKELIKKTERPISRLEHLYETRDAFQSTVDHVARQIIQCAVVFFNESDDYDKSIKSAELLDHVKGMSINQLTREKYDQNYKSIKEEIDNLPPKEIFVEVHKLRTLLHNYINDRKYIDEAESFLSKCGPLLDAIHSKTEQQGIESSQYLKHTSLIVINIIRCIYIQLHKTTDGLTYTPDKGKRKVIMNYHKELREARRIIKMLDKYQLDTSSVYEYKDLRKRVISAYRYNASNVGCFIYLGFAIIGAIAGYILAGDTSAIGISAFFGLILGSIIDQIREGIAKMLD